MKAAQAIRIAFFSFVLASPLACLGDSPIRSPSVMIFSKASPSLVHLKTLGTLYSGEQEISWGTGFVISADGLVLTCSHVVPDQNLYKTLKRQAYIVNSENNADGEEFEVVKRDLTTDLALIKLKNPRTLQALPIGDSDAIETGEELYVLGFPLNYSLSIVGGVLSNKMAGDDKWLTQAPLNPGNSGGPAVSPEGSVVAIAVGGIPKARVYQGGLKYDEINIQGINHLLPINVAKSKILASINLKGGKLIDSLDSAAVFTSPHKINKSYAVSEINEEHPVLFGTYTRSYELVVHAEPGYKIVRATLVKISATRVSDERLEISPGGLQAHLQFNLSSGPAVDRYRSWLDASIETAQELLIP